MEKSGLIFHSDSLRSAMEVALKQVREEFDEHRESINDNTCEIEANYELMCRLESKVDKLQAQLEQLQLFLQSEKPSDRNCIDLDEKEKEIFLILYTAPGQLNYRDIASGVKESEFLVRGFITSMIEKGIPVIKRYVNDTAFISLEASFRDLQARQNIVRLSQKTVTEFAA